MWMRRLFRYGLYCLGGMAFLVVLALVGINLPQTKRLLERKLPDWTGGMIQAEGVEGIVPWHLALSHVVLKDPQGVWLEGRHADLRLGLLALLHKQVHIRNLSAEELDYVRNPSFPSDPNAPKTSSTSLPNWGVKLDRLALSRLTVGKDVFGQDAALQIEGKAALESLSAFSGIPAFTHMTEASLSLTAQRLDHPAHLQLDLRTGRHEADGQLHYDEDAQGFASSPGGLNVLDPLAVDLSLHGPYGALKTQLAVKAATQQETPLTADMQGSLDLLHLTDDLTLAFHAPAMVIRPGMGWETLDMKAAVQGAMLDPHGTVQLDGTDLTASGAGVERIHFQLGAQNGGIQALLARDAAALRRVLVGRPLGDDSRLSLSARLDGISLPGKASTILAAAPLTLEATIQPYHEDRPYQIDVEHDAVHLGMTGTLTSNLTGHMQLDMDRLPDLTVLLGQNLSGLVHVSGDVSLPLGHPGDMTAALDGQFGLKEGPAPAVALIADQGTLHVRVKRQNDGSIHLEQATLGGKAFHLEGNALLDQKQVLSSSLKLSLSDMMALNPALRGHLFLDTAVEGPLTDLAMKVHLTGRLGVVHSGTILPEAPLDMQADLIHLPSQPQGTVQVSGALDSSPLKLSMEFARKVDGEVTARLDTLTWKDLQGRAALTLPAGRLIPQGDVELRVSRLDGFSRLLGRPMTGHVQLGLHTLPGAGKNDSGGLHDRLHLLVDGQFRMGSYVVNALNLKGDVQHLYEDPVIDMGLKLSGLRVNEMTGDLQVLAKGPQSALAIQGHGVLDHVMQSSAQFSLAALVNIPGQEVHLNKLSAGLKGDEIKLLSPAVLHYGQTLSVEHLSAELRPPHGIAGRVFLDGSLKPELALEARLERITAALAKPFVASLPVEGEFAAAAKVKGSLTAPEGRVTLDGKGIRFISEATDSLPAGRLHVQADMDGKQARLQTELRAGDPIALLIAGQVPLKPDGALGVTAKGRVELSAANAFLGTGGMGVGGQLSLDLGVKGTLQQPQLSGTVQLHSGSFDHFAEGVHLHAMDAVLTARGDALNVDHFTARAGQGTLGLTGQIGVLHPGLPVDLHFAMDKAQPVQSDMLTEEINSRLHIYGQATTRLDVDGNIIVPEASITLPDSMPASVPQLEVITPDQAKTVSRPAPKLVIGLNIDFISPEKLFVRGHGLFAEMQGKLHIGGVSSAPVVTGGINLKRGNFNLAGINLNFTYGQVGFNGASAAHKLDPTVDFRADRNANGTLASLLVRGYASNPKIDFVSNPSRPRDEVLSILLFGADRSSLSSTQLASLGLAVVQIGGGSAFDPMGKVRSSLGLDHLAIGGGNSVGNGAASVEAGKYVMKGVYVGAKEGLSGKGAQAQVKVDLTKRLQLNTTVGTGGQVTGFTTPENDPGSSIGLSYGIDY